jgi:hypothetical protein
MSLARSADVGGFLVLLRRVPRRLVALVGLSIVLNVTEAAVVYALFPRSDAPLALQASAVAPFGTFHDLRWLAVYSPSSWSFGLGLAALVLGRGALTALAVFWAWPLHTIRPRPSLRALMGRGAWSTTFAALLLAPSVAVLFAMAIVPISWLFIAAVPLALIVIMIVSPVEVSGEWWRRPPSVRAEAWVVASFLAASAGSLALSHSPRWVVLPLAATFGVFNALAWWGLVHALVARRPRRLVLPVEPALLVALALGVTLGSVDGFVHARAHTKVFPTASAARFVPGTGAVLVLHGYGSSWNGLPVHPIPGAFDEQVFSYKGEGPEGEPLPYDGADTVQSLPALVDELAEQVEALAHHTHEPVDLVGESEGSDVAQTYVLTHPHAPVRVVVLLSPLVAPGRVSFPVTGPGKGAAARAALRLLGGAYSSVSPVDLSPSSAFVRSLDVAGERIDGELDCKAPHVREFAILPLADATSSTSAVSIGMPYLVLPAFHGGLLNDPVAQRAVGQVLSGENPVGDRLLDLAEHIVAGAAAAWQVPATSAVRNCTVNR